MCTILYWEERECASSVFGARVQVYCMCMYACLWSSVREVHGRKNSAGRETCWLHRVLFVSSAQLVFCAVCKRVHVTCFSCGSYDTFRGRHVLAQYKFDRCR